MDLKHLYQKTQESIWKIGFIQNSLDDILNGKPLSFKWVKMQSDRWWADPFILDETETEIILLVEEFKYKQKRGTIAKLVINKKSMDVLSDEEILVLDSHLSFPAIKRRFNSNDKNNFDVFVYPENSKRGVLKEYHYDQEKNVLVDDKVICNEPLTDAIYTEMFGEPLLFSTKEPDPNGNVLGVYRKKLKANSLEKELFEQCGEVTFEEKIARNAGDWFKYKGKTYRPAQECEAEYGHGTYIQEITYDENNKFHFKNVRKLFSEDNVFDRGLHTFNISKDLIVIDVKGYRYPKIARFLKKIRNLK